jgi:hypothetical protein
VRSAAALIDGKPLTGTWFDRTREYAAHNQRQEITPRQFAEEESVILSLILCWAPLPPKVYCERIASLVEEVKSEAALARSLQGISALGTTNVGESLADAGQRYEVSGGNRDVSGCRPLDREGWPHYQVAIFVCSFSSSAAAAILLRISQYG